MTKRELKVVVMTAIIKGCTYHDVLVCGDHIYELHIDIDRQSDGSIGSIMVNVTVLLIARWWVL